MLVPINWEPDRATLAGFSEAGMFMVGMVAAPVALLRERFVLAGVAVGGRRTPRLCAWSGPSG